MRDGGESDARVFQLACDHLRHFRMDLVCQAFASVSVSVHHLTVEASGCRTIEAPMDRCMMPRSEEFQNVVGHILAENLLRLLENLAEGRFEQRLTV